ncbi:MAG TPA: ABC transporter permease, partial [Acidimicrobiales bacterium]|nr:ABC transporter permease [Acidimicrobiales bacterium]
SPVFPVGPLRRSGLFGGVSTDLTVLGAGGVILALAIAGVVAIGSQRRRAGSRLASSGRVPGVLASRPAAATGLRFAIAQRGVLSTVAGVAAGISIVVACATFSGSLDRLIDDPALVGMDWDAGARSVSRFAPVDVEQVQTVVRADPAFDRVTGLRYLIGTVDGTIVPVAVVNALKGNPWPPITSGRAPVASDEVLVGRATLDELGVDVGERITISLPEDVNAFDPSNTNTVAQSYTVVGSAVAPAIGEPGQYTPKLAVGALVSIEGLGWLAAQAPPTVVLFGLADDARVSAVFDRFPDGVPFQGESTDWFTSAEPAEVSQAARARTVIWIAVGALAVAIVAAVVHTPLVSVRQRRREYAVLKAIGFTGRQVRATVLWQSGAIFGLAMAFALPVGVGVGRWLWRAFADGLGIVTDPTVPVLLLGAFVLVTAAAVQSAAMLPATIARRVVVDRWVRPE